MENGSFMSSISLYVGKILRKMSVREKAKQYIDFAKNVALSFQFFYNKEGETSIGINPEMLQTASGIADTGDLQNDLTELLVHLGKVGQKINTGAILFIDWWYSACCSINYVAPSAATITTGRAKRIGESLHIKVSILHEAAEAAYAELKLRK